MNEDFLSANEIVGNIANDFHHKISAVMPRIHSILCGTKPHIDRQHPNRLNGNGGMTGGENAEKQNSNGKEKFYVAVHRI